MYENILNKYKNHVKTKMYHNDGKIIVNKCCDQKELLGRNTKYKSKNSINLQTVTDEFGIPIRFSILSGSASEIGNMVKVLNDIDIEDANHTKNQINTKNILQQMLDMIQMIIAIFCRVRDIRNSFGLTKEIQKIKIN